ncbi:MAG: bile acid:sodium symporter family protein [Oceanobacter sp.]
MLAKLISVGLPVSLILVMTGVGLGLKLDDFRRVLTQPKGFMVGAIAQLILLPIVAIILIEILGLTGSIAVGLFIIALCPGGTTSNLYSVLAKADVGLSVSLTAVIGFITPFTIPLLGAWAISHYGAEGAIALPIAKTFIQLLVVGVIPVIVGMAIRAKWTEFAVKAEPWVNRFSVFVLAFVIVAICLKLGPALGAAVEAAGPAALALNLVTMGAGYLLGKTLLHSEAQARTIGLEVGLQNGTMALLITSTILQDNLMSMAPIIYSLLMFVTATLFTLVIGRRSATVATA